jgi:hypothetical protein
VHNAHGDYQLDIHTITEAAIPRSGGVRITVQATVLPAPEHGNPVPVTTEFTLENGLITWIVSKPGASQGG